MLERRGAQRIWVIAPEQVCALHHQHLQSYGGRLSRPTNVCDTWSLQIVFMFLLGT